MPLPPLSSTPRTTSPLAMEVDVPDLPEPGIPGFAPELVRAVNTSRSLNGWHADGSLLVVFLMALMVRRGGVILDVATGGNYAPNSCIGHASRVATALANSVFGLETQIIHVHPTSSVTDVTFGAATGAIVITGLEDAPAAVQVRFRNETARVAKKDNGGPLIIWVRDETRRDESGTPPWLLDLFACSAPVYPEDIESPPIGLRRTALISAGYITDLSFLLLITHIHPPLETHISNLIAALALHPNLSAGLSTRATAALTMLVRAQRLLAADFYLPPDWKEALDNWRAVQCSERGRRVHSEIPGARSGLGLAGGPGGVVTWGRKAGEVPTAETMLGPGAEGWYCLPRNVAGAFELAVRHRVRARRPGEAALYALQGSAEERVQHARRDDARDRREEAVRRRREVDRALEAILLSL